MEYKEILRIEEKIRKYEDLLDNKEGTDGERQYWIVVLGKLRKELDAKKSKWKN